MDQVVQVAGHPAVVALPQAIGFAPAAVIQQHAAPAPRLARPQQSPHIGRPQVALQSRQHDHDRAARANPVQPHKIPVGKLHTLRPHVEPDSPRQNRPEGLAVPPRQPPTRLESITGHDFPPRLETTLLLLEFHTTAFKLFHDFRRFFEFDQRSQLAADVGPVELAGLANDNPFHVQPVFGAQRRPSAPRDPPPSKCAVTYRREMKKDSTSRQQTPRKASRPRQCLDQRQSGAYEQHAPRERKVGSVGNPSVKVLKKLANKGLLAAKTGQQSQVHVRSLPWLSPTLQRETTDDTEPPALGFAETLNFRSSTNDLNHGRELSLTIAVVQLARKLTAAPVADAGSQPDRTAARLRAGRPDSATPPVASAPCLAPLPAKPVPIGDRWPVLPASNPQGSKAGCYAIILHILAQ